MNLAKVMKQFNKDRDKAILSMDVNEFKKFYKKYAAKGIYDPRMLPPDNVIEVSMRKMTLHINSSTKEQKAEALKWLLDNGFTGDIG